jgi:GcrA cell cycle regulator
MSWDAKDLATLKELWTAGQSAAQIAHRLGYSRNAVCAKLLRMGLKRGHKPPTANPKIIARPSVAACHRPMEKVMSSHKPKPKEFTKRQLCEMLAEAVANTARLLR